jgi:hypothetical protein
MQTLRPLAPVILSAVIPLVGVPRQATAHGPGTTWSYPPACCSGDAHSGDCERIPLTSVRIDRSGYAVVLNPGDHHLVTGRHRYFIPHGSEIPSGDGDFHICLHPSEREVNCFFAPSGGA